jgi:putative cell wall-binding protein
MPPTGFLSEVGFPPVPVDNPCTTVVAGGVTQRVARMDDARATAAAVTALRAAGMRDVVTPVAGVVRFGGDDRRAAAVLGGAGVAADVSTDRVAAYATVPNDPGYAAQWNLPLINAPQAWSITHGSSAVVVADLDSGVDATQPDLQGKLVPGFDVAQRAPLPNTNTDDTGHGTAVAGLIAATPDNGIELAGVGWSTRVAEVKMSNPPTIGDIVAGIQWAAGQRIPIINLSLGGCSDPTEAAAVQAAQAGGSLIVASVGNDALDGNPREFPAAYPGVIGVGATAHDGSRALYSEVGPQVALVAPGGSADGNPSDDLPVLAPGGGTTTAAGTSFAAPQVAGAAALILAADPSLTPDDAGQLLVATASPVGPSAEFGHGRLDMQAGLLAAARLARVAGPDRYATSVALVQSGWNAIPRPPVYLASGANFPDALSAGVVAGINGAPILLTDTCALPAGTAAELRALNPSAVYLIGGTAAICDAVAAAVAQVLGFPPGRIAGADRYVTNAQVVATAFPSQVSTAYVTTGANFPDGLTGSPRAAKDGAPLLLTDTCALPPAVAAQLGRLQPTLVKVLGGTSAVCPAVLDQIVKATGGAAVDRIAGATRVDTGVLVAQDGWSQSTSALVASAGNFPDALSAGALATLDHAPLLINDTCAADPSVASELRSLGVSQVTVVGGSAALCGAAVAPLGAAIR